MFRLLRMMDFKQYLIKTFADYYKPPKAHRYDLSLLAVFKEAWALAKGQRWRFWAAHYMVVILGFMPVIAPYAAVHYPQLLFVSLMPVVPTPVAALLTKVMPVFYFVFVMIPLYLSLFLIAARIVYHKAYQPTRTIWHYFRFFWLSNVFKVMLAWGFFVGTPILFVLSKLLLITFKGNVLAMQVIFAITLVVLSLLAVYFLISCLLLFIGRVSLVSGVKTMLQAVNQHVFKLWLLMVMEIAGIALCQVTWHVFDLIWVPFSYLMWLVIYKKMFGLAYHDDN